MTFAGIQSIYKKAWEFDPFDIVIIDEAHMVPSKDAGMYRKFLTDCKESNPNLRVVGLTATPYRLDNGLLTEGDDRIFTDVCYSIAIKTLLDEKHLAPVRCPDPITHLNLKGVKTSCGDFMASDQAKAGRLDGFLESALEEIIEHGKARKSWLIFCPTVEYAEEVHDVLNCRDISCDIVTGKTEKDERERILSDFKAGLTKAVVNVNVLTTGFDAPCIDMVVFLRATKSLALYVQMTGRGMRTAEGKADCLVLDFGGNVERHGPIDCVVPPPSKGKKQKGEAPTKKCPDCREILMAFTKVCPVCGFEFPMKDPHEHTATTAAILSEDIKPVYFPVSQVMYSRHAKAGKRASLKVTYQCGIKIFQEWICLEHDGYARNKARKWWGERSADPAPKTIADALAYIDSSGITKPEGIEVLKTGKYHEIKQYIFGEVQAQEPQRQIGGDGWAQSWRDVAKAAQNKSNAVK